MREYKLVLTVPQCKALNRRKTHNEMALRKKKAKLRIMVYVKIKVNRDQRCVLSSHTGINTIFPTYINNIHCALISHIKGYRFSFWWGPYCPSICFFVAFFCIRPTFSAGFTFSLLVVPMLFIILGSALCCGSFIFLFFSFQFLLFIFVVCLCVYFFVSLSYILNV